MARVRAKKKDTGLYSYRSRTVRAELLDALGPGEFFPCDHPLVGTTIQGRKGGTITGCATPSRKHAKELHLYVGLPAIGTAFRASTIRDRRRGKTARETKPEREERYLRTLANVEQWREDSFPAPVGRVYPGRQGSSKCDPEHPAWSGYDLAVEEADAEAAQRFDDPSSVSAKRYREAQRAELERLYPAEFRAWDQITRGCVEAYEMKYPRSKGYESPQAEVARRRRDYIQRGGDVGHGDWTDYLADSTKAAKERARNASRKKRTKR